MEHVTVKDLVLGSGGVLVSGSEEAPVSHIRLDSRQVEPGDLFVPLLGERVDSHRFLPQVMSQGAAAVLTSQEAAFWFQGVRKRLSPISAWIPGRWSRETFLCPCWASGWTATASFPR